MKNQQRLFIWVFFSSVLILGYDCTAIAGFYQFANYRCDSIFTTQSILPNKNQIFNDLMNFEVQLSEAKPDTQPVIQQKIFQTLSDLTRYYGDSTVNEYYQYKKENKSDSRQSNQKKSKDSNQDHQSKEKVLFAINFKEMTSIEPSNLKNLDIYDSTRFFFDHKNNFNVTGSNIMAIVDFNNISQSVKSFTDLNFSQLTSSIHKTKPLYRQNTIVRKFTTHNDPILFARTLGDRIHLFNYDTSSMRMFPELESFKRSSGLKIGRDFFYMENGYQHFLINKDDLSFIDITHQLKDSAIGIEATNNDDLIYASYSDKNIYKLDLKNKTNHAINLNGLSFDDLVNKNIFSYHDQILFMNPTQFFAILDTQTMNVTKYEVDSFHHCQLVTSNSTYLRFENDHLALFIDSSNDLITLVDLQNKTITQDTFKFDKLDQILAMSSNQTIDYIDKNIIYRLNLVTSQIEVLIELPKIPLIAKHTQYFYDPQSIEIRAISEDQQTIMRVSKKITQTFDIGSMLDGNNVSLFFISKDGNNIALTTVEKVRFHHFHFFRIYDP